MEDGQTVSGVCFADNQLRVRREGISLPALVRTVTSTAAELSPGPAPAPKSEETSG